MPAPPPAAPAAPGAPLPSDLPGTLTGTETSRRLLCPEEASRAITLWGSSSMSSEGGAEATPLPIRIHEHLALAAAPATVHAHGVGATTSAHTLLMRGLDRPVATPSGAPAPDTGAVTLTLDSGLDPAGPLRIPGEVGGVPGLLDGSSGQWLFTPEDSEQPVAAGPFTSTLAETAGPSRQVLWVGKNNIQDTAAVLADTQRMWDAAADPGADTLVLGHWPTEFDAIGSPTGQALAAVNAEQRQRYGDHFLDLQELLTGETGLACAPIAALQLLDQGSTQDALERGVVPPLLVATDSVHLNGWGNLAVCWSIIQRMRELRWL